MTRYSGVCVTSPTSIRLKKHGKTSVQVVKPTNVTAQGTDWPNQPHENIIRPTIMEDVLSDYFSPQQGSPTQKKKNINGRLDLWDQQSSIFLGLEKSRGQKSADLTGDF